MLAIRKSYSTWGLLALLAYAAGFSLAILFQLQQFILVFKVLPFVLLGIYLLTFQTNFTFWATIFVIPLSVNFPQLAGGIGMSFPGEILVWIFAIGLIAKGILNNWLDMKILRHPVTVIIFLQLFWIIVTTFTSAYQPASIKLLTARIIFLVVFYFFLSGRFRNFNHLKRFFWLYLLGCVPIIFIALNRLSVLGFQRAASPVMATPWFTDHTVFGVCLTMLFPFFLLWMLSAHKTRINSTAKTVLWMLVPLLFSGILFSFSRASWLSLIVAMVFYLLIRLKLKFPGFLALASVSVFIFFSLGESLENSSQLADKDANTFVSTVSSITDTERDESNLERLNRWSCAIRMYQDRPLFGWGPGTYENFYGPYQLASETTRISTFNGDRGDAHSEYLGALAEQGMPGLVLTILLMVVIFGTGLRVIYNANSVQVKIAATGILLGLITFWFHGTVNSFLDIEKAAVLIWAFSGMIVALDIWHKKPKQVGKIS